ncbi:MAG: NAD-dependent epimerase/dehydratase family protein [Bradymonadaceae bacterium]|nr:NAD-dependent epimerase/dehydratase family protein [Lujinxingiaceae bacterium]
MKPKILVLGGTGFVGAETIRRLLERGYGVRATRRATSPMWHVESLDVEWVELDLDQSDSLVGAFKGCAGVIHAAGFHPTDGLAIAQARSTGVRQMRHVLDACAGQGVRRVVFVSSAVTLGSAQQNDLRDETDFYAPGEVDDALFEAKYSIESELYRYISQDFEIVIALPSQIYGPGDVKPGSGQFIVRLVRGHVPLLVGERINVVDVRDVASSLVAALERGRSGRRYILGGVNTDAETFANMVCEQAAVAAPKIRLPNAVVRGGARGLEMLGQHLGGRLPARLVDIDVAIHGGHLDCARAEGELGHSSRALSATIEDSLAWFSRFGYLNT